MTQLNIPIESTTLPNGLRVVISPDRTAPVATVGVYYNIGFRIEPRGRSGFAHLFEHMMFQGSANAGKMVHIKLINSSGGVLNGSTHYDVTNYYESVPSNALERVLWLEADRMRALKVDDENLRNQRDVVKEEVRVNVLNQPYGGFPWLDLPPIAYRNWSNAHNFYGDFDDLDAATLEDVQKFFKTYYAPSNAVLLILGDVDADEGIQLAERHFASIPSGPQPSPADIDEPPQIEERRGVVEEKFGTLPGIAIGYQCAAPPHARVVRRGHARSGAAWRARGPRVSPPGARAANRGRRRGRHPLSRRRFVRLQRPDAHGDAHSAQARIFRGPDHRRLRSDYRRDEREGNHRRGTGADQSEIPVELFFHARGRARRLHPAIRADAPLACFSLFDNDPKLVNTILGGFMEVTPEAVQSVAQKLLTRHNRSIVIRQPAKKGAA